ncbi:hypothetical protein SCANM63S_04464 [Streptomyces canarius]
MQDGGEGVLFRYRVQQRGQCLTVGDVAGGEGHPGAGVGEFADEIGGAGCVRVPGRAVSSRRSAPSAASHRATAAPTAPVAPVTSTVPDSFQGAPARARACSSRRP